MKEPDIVGINNLFLAISNFKKIDLLTNEEIDLLLLKFSGLYKDVEID
jgi:hypothetical protein